MDLKAFAIFLFHCEFAMAIRVNNNLHSGATLEENCGIPLVVRRGGGRIIGGISALQGEWPWQVALLQVDPSTKTLTSHHCGGALLNQNWILTAAHCLVDPFLKFTLPPPFWRVRIGDVKLRPIQDDNSHMKFANDAVQQNFESELYKEDEDPQSVFYPELMNDDLYQVTSHSDFEVKRIILHKEFSSITWSNDLALVKFLNSESSSHKLIPICLPNPTQIFEGDDCSVSGWGRTSMDGENSNILQTISVPVLDNEKCRKLYKNIGKFSDGMICAGGHKGNAGPCVGDSGSPLQCNSKNSERWFLAGTTSWGYGCGRINYPAVYIGVHKYLHWIKTNIKQ